VSDLPALEDEYSRIYDDALKLVEDVTKADEHLGAQLSRLVDDLNYNRYNVHCVASRGEEIIQEYEDIMDCTFTIVEVPNSRASGLNSWCIDNIKGDWHRLEGDRMAFTNKDEAVMFKLVWGGKS
jgi:hypothetical protein